MLYYDARVAYLNTTLSDALQGTPDTATYPTTRGYTLAPAVGGEYLLGSRVSLGGEVQFRFISTKTTPSSSPYASPTLPTFTTAATHGAFVLRFYFR